MQNDYNPSILHDGNCTLCGKLYPVVRHEVFYGNGKRQKCKRLGLWVTLCPQCHTLGENAIHNNHREDLKLKAWAQKKAMKYYRWDEDTFRREFGKSYLEEGEQP